MKPEVTVCITSYNRFPKLLRALKSVLRQSYSDYEIIIVDDASDKELPSRITNLVKKNKKIRLIEKVINEGLAAARNDAIREAKGQYFTFLDDDDVWENNFLKECVEIAKQHKGLTCFYGGTIAIFGNRKIKSMPSFKGALRQAIKKGFTPPVSSQFYFIKSLRKIGGYNEKIKSGVDHDLWLRLSAINPYLVPVQKAYSIPNRNSGERRITTQISDRRKGVIKSLDIWKELIEKNYGNNFYIQFSKAYEIYLLKKEVLTLFSNRDYRNFFRRLFKNEYYPVVLLQLIKGVYRGLYIRVRFLTTKEITLSARPTFVPFK
jgi:glycosyltransferase involved in cell wall biosynthesis